MILDVTQFKEGIPESVHGSLDVKVLDVEYVDLHYKNRIEISGTVEKILHMLTFCGSIQSKVEHICARCLKAVEEEIKDSLNLTFEIKDIETIDLTNDVRDTLMLSHPEKFLCHVNCKGLCPSCGTDLNVESCHCESRRFQSKIL